MAEIVTVVGPHREPGLLRVLLTPAACKSCHGGHCARAPRELAARVAPDVAERVEAGSLVRIESPPGSIVRAVGRLLIIPAGAAGVTFGIIGRFTTGGGGEALQAVAAVTAALCALGIAVVRGARRADLPVVLEVVGGRRDAYPARSSSGFVEARLSGG